MDATLFHLCHKIYGLTDMPMRGHLLGISSVIFYPKISNKTLKVPNNTDGMNRVYCFLLFLEPNKWPLFCRDGQTYEWTRANLNAPPTILEWVYNKERTYVVGLLSGSGTTTGMADLSVAGISECLSVRANIKPLTSKF